MNRVAPRASSCVGLGSPRRRSLGRDLDLVDVASDIRAVLGENAELALERWRVAEAVPDVGVLGHDSQRLLLAPAADQDRDACAWAAG